MKVSGRAEAITPTTPHMGVPKPEPRSLVTNDISGATPKVTKPKNIFIEKQNIREIFNQDPGKYRGFKADQDRGGSYNSYIDSQILMRDDITAYARQKLGKRPGGRRKKNDSRFSEIMNKTQDGLNSKLNSTSDTVGDFLDPYSLAKSPAHELSTCTAKQDGDSILIEDSRNKIELAKTREKPLRHRLNISDFNLKPYSGMKNQSLAMNDVMKHLKRPSSVILTPNSFRG